MTPIGRGNKLTGCFIELSWDGRTYFIGDPFNIAWIQPEYNVCMKISSILLLVADHVM